MRDYSFEIEMKVRDYECDIQGIVNNAVYLNYMEQTRHEFLLSEGISFIELHKYGIDPVVARIEVDYKTSLTSDDVFISKMRMMKDGIKHVFLQEIYRKKDMKMAVSAKVEVVTLVDGKLTRGEHFDAIFQKKENE